jgi:hypothetical protein
MATLALTGPQARFAPFPAASGFVGNESPGSDRLGGRAVAGRPVGESVEGEKVRQATANARTNLAEQILRDALERYRRPDGYEGDLVESAWQLEQLGRDAWPVLRKLAQSGELECELFLDVIVRLDGVTPNQRATALLAAARNPNPNVRSRVLELVEEMPHDLRREVLRELTAEERPDDSVTDRARLDRFDQAL